MPSSKTPSYSYTVLFLLLLLVLVAAFSLAARSHGFVDDAKQFIAGLEKRGYHGP